MLEVIAYHARRAPDSIAAYVDGRELTYLDMLKALSRLVVGLQGLPLMPGQLVGVACPSDFLHLMMMFALEALGIVALPFAQPTDPGIEKALVHCNLILASQPTLVARPFVQVTLEWLRSVISGPDPSAIAVPSVRAPGYVLTTSGTTGAAKAMRLGAASLTLREHDRIWQYGLTRTSRFSVAMPITVGGVYSTARACLRARGAVIFQAGAAPEVSLPFTTHVVLLPIHVRHLLNLLPPAYVPTQPLALISMGARLPDSLRNRAVERLGAVVHDGYGANETGPISVVDANGQGDVLPGVEIRIVNDAGEPLRFGEVGHIWVRSHSQITGYLEPEHSKRYLHDGWFDTGDLGKQSSSRLLQVLGRPDAMLNIGGLKVASEEIEDLLITQQVAKDIAVCALPDAEGIQELYVALVDPAGGDAHLMASIAHHLGANFGHIRVVRFARIPRGAGGKIQRNELQRLLQEVVGRSA
jgi:acyl-CoA synthetase (AMP-forming)/AMP-acid ligase II